VHPYISQSLAAERVKDRQRNSEHAWLVRQARALRHTATTTPTAKTQPAPTTQPGAVQPTTVPPATAQTATAQTATAQTATAQTATGASLVAIQAGQVQRKPAGDPADQRIRAA
jgi:hypothetical protein